MARIIFKNPNEPQQPARGVYRWLVSKDASELTLYVGQAGKVVRGVGEPSTLKRGILEAQRGSLTSEKARRKLDTDFVVGTALRFYRDLGHDCIWEHIADDPRDESRLCSELRPLLQGAKPIIRSAFKPRKPGRSRWEHADVALAESLLRVQFEKHLRVVPWHNLGPTAPLTKPASDRVLRYLLVTAQSRTCLSGSFDDCRPRSDLVGMFRQEER